MMTDECCWRAGREATSCRSGDASLTGLAEGWLEERQQHAARLGQGGLSQGLLSLLSLDTPEDTISNDHLSSGPATQSPSHPLSLVRMSLRRLGPLALLLVLLPVALAIQANLAGVIDWHEPKIGLPRLSQRSTAPSFHGSPGTEASILTLTKSNVLASLNATDGSICMSCSAI